MKFKLKENKKGRKRDFPSDPVVYEPALQWKEHKFNP